MNFEILTPTPIYMEKGTFIDYRIKIFGFPTKWKTQITRWNPPFEFQDTQVRGPYQKWIHTHSFEEYDGKTLMKDHVEYLPHGGLFEPIIDKFFVRRQIHRIFTYRKQKFKEIFSGMNP